MSRRLLCDVHGVLADLNGALLPVIERVLGRPCRREEIRTYYLQKAFGMNDGQWAEVCRAIEQPGFAASFAPIGDAPSRVQRLISSRLVDEVVFVTQPWRGSRTWHADVEAWLDAHVPTLARYVAHTSEKYCVGGTYLLDDSPEHIAAWKLEHAHRGGRPLLWHAPYNEEHAMWDRYRMRSWDDVERFLTRGGRYDDE